MGGICAGGPVSFAYEEHVQTLRQIPLMGNLSEGDLKNICKHLKERKFKEGEHLMQVGEQGKEFFLITHGKCEVKTAEGVVVAELNEGDYCGEQALLHNCVRNATVYASEADTICLVMDRKTFNDTLGQADKVVFAKREAVHTHLEEDEDVSDQFKTKNEEQFEWMCKAVARVALFDTFDEDQIVACVDSMYRLDFEKKDKIIEQGEQGSKFYLIERGEADVIVDQKKVAILRKGDCFGEVALLHKTPRNATVRARRQCRLWCVGRTAFRRAVRQLYQGQTQETLQTLQKIQAFSSLLSNELVMIADALVENPYEKGDVIVKEGEPGEKFYIIKRGVAIWSKQSGEQGEIKQFGYFGELALINEEKRAATVTAKTKNLVCLELTRGEFTTLMGPMEDILKMRADVQYKQKKLTQILETYGSINGGKKSVIHKDVCGLKTLKTLGVLGRGAFGFVTLVMDPKSKETYALKAIRKQMIQQSKQDKIILREKNVMQQLRHPRLVNLHTTYKDEYRLYFLLDACLGGELFTILRKKRYFSEKTSRFYAAAVILGFEYMHNRSIIYRDLKPENLVLETNGYLKITDFGFAKFIVDKTYTLCGTPDYLAPEIVTGQGHGKGVDWWTVGVLIFEMVAGCTPFFSSDQTEMYRKIVRGKYRTPKYFSYEVKDLIRRLLVKRPTKRLGVTVGGAEPIKNHAWFQSFPWDDFMAHKMQAPIAPKVKNNQDYSNFKQSRDPDERNVKAMTLEIEKDF